MPLPVNRPNFGSRAEVLSRHPHLAHLSDVQRHDHYTILRKEEEYDASWKQRGGVGAFMMLARKWDRVENQVRALGYDIFSAIVGDRRPEGILDDIADLRRYLTLVEAYARHQGWVNMDATDGPNPVVLQPVGSDDPIDGSHTPDWTQRNPSPAPEGPVTVLKDLMPSRPVKLNGNGDHLTPRMQEL